MRLIKWLGVYLLLAISIVKISYSRVPMYPQKNTFDHADTQWAIIGAGPAGIITVSLLLWLGIKGTDIAWLDPEFNVGRMGQLYTNVPGNLTTAGFIKFINACPIFKEFYSPTIEALSQYDPEKFYELKFFVDPLVDITKHLRTRVFSIQNKLTSLDFDNDIWRIGIEGGIFTAAHVVLAIGSHPRSLDYDNKPEIPLDIALDRASLAKQVAVEDSIAVVGSAHSAILLLKFLSELPVARIINFYKKPIVYAVQSDGWVMNQEEGLKGTAAEWAQNVLEKNPPANLIRIFNKPEALKAWLPICNKIIYAVGYERNPLPPINGTLNNITYDDRTGVIAPRLFGIGIAFPEKYTDPSGHTYHRVGLPFFMEYALRVIPEWINSKDAARKDFFSRFAQFEDLFIIDIL